MYERFSDRARKVMQLANQEAQALNHEYIGTEHMLLGLIKEGSGVAGVVLKDLKVDANAVAAEIKKLVQPGPEMVTMGKLPQTPRAKKVIELAMEQARILNHNHVGTEHLLLGLLKEKEGIAYQVLDFCGINHEAVLAGVNNILGIAPATERFSVTAAIRVEKAEPNSWTVRQMLQERAKAQFAGLFDKLPSENHQASVKILKILKELDAMEVRLGT